MSQKSPFGEPIDIRKLSPAPLNGGTLPYPGKNPPSHIPVVEEEAEEPTNFVSPTVYTQAFVPPTTQTATKAVSTEKPVPPPNYQSMRESDTIGRIRKSFGVKSIPLKHFPFAGYKWSFRVPSATDMQWTIIMIQDILGPAIKDDNNLGIILARTAMVSICIAALDDVPIYKHFGIDVGNRDIRDPMYPPRDIRIQGAQALYDVLSDETFAGSLCEPLENFYNTEILPIIEARLNVPLVQEVPSST